MLKIFLKDSAIYTIPAFISRGLSILLVPLYTRVLSPADYGAIDMLTVFGSIVNLTIALEVSQGVARYYAGESDPDKKIQYASTAFWFTLFCYTLFLALTLLFTVNLARVIMGQAGLENIFQLGMVYLWLNGLFYLIQNQFRWELRSKNYAVVSILVAVITACISVILAYGSRLGITGILIGMIAGCVAGCLYGLWHLRNTFQFRFQRQRLKEMLLFSVPLVPSGITVFVSLYIDRMMINHYLSLDAVGLYGIGFRLASIVGLVMVGFQGALTPLVYAHYREEQTPAQLALIFRIFVSLSLMIFIFMSAFASEILWMMTMPAYYAAAHLVSFLVPAILLSNMYIFAPGIGIAKKTYYFLWINLAGAVLMTMLNWLLIPLFGIMGAAIAKLAGYACVFAAYMIISQRFYYIPHAWMPLGISAIVAALMAFCSSHIDIGFAMNLVLKTALLIGAGLLFTVTGLVRWSEIEKACLHAKGWLLRTTS